VSLKVPEWLQSGPPLTREEAFHVHDAMLHELAHPTTWKNLDMSLHTPVMTMVNAVCDERPKSYSEAARVLARWIKQLHGLPESERAKMIASDLDGIVPDAEETTVAK
jgi:hypothetical protein